MDIFLVKLFSFFARTLQWWEDIFLTSKTEMTVIYRFQTSVVLDSLPLGTVVAFLFILARI